jgi:predicted metal-dependent peptidase
MQELEQFLKISRELERHHSLFYILWEMGVPVFTKSIKTAGVKFDRDGNVINFLFNTEFWDSLSDYEKSFIICHECLHVCLSHGTRTKNDKTPKITNIALDIVVNHMLVRKFDFNRDKLSNELNNSLCWVDTVFYDEESDNECFEYYYNRIKKECTTFMSSIDDHSGLSESDWNEAGQEINKKLTHEEKHNLEETLVSTGTTAGSLLIKADMSEPVKKKRKWETVIKSWSKKYIKKGLKETEQWARLNRRFSFCSTDMFLPSEMEIEDKEENKNKIDILFFQDTSDSCFSFKDRFFKAARSLPENKFNIEFCCFDTEVYETSIESGELYGFGGTSYQVLEEYITKKVNDGQKYPEAIFVISDGYGDSICPKYPKRWYFFLSTSYTLCIPEECNILQLKDFE